jgi:hypothetical protein
LILAVIFVPAFVFASSCDSGGAEYYINFTLEGAEYSCTFGFADGEKDPFAASQLGGSYTFMGGVSGETDMYGEPSGDYARVEITFEGAAAATFTSAGVSYDVDIWMYTEGMYYHYYASSGTLEITTYEEVGGAVAGSFDLTLEGGIETFVLGDSPLTTTGSFRVKNIGYTLPTI